MGEQQQHTSRRRRAPFARHVQRLRRAVIKAAVTLPGAFALPTTAAVCGMVGVEWLDQVSWTFVITTTLALHISSTLEHTRDAWLHEHSAKLAIEDAMATGVPPHNVRLAPRLLEKLGEQSTDRARRARFVRTALVATVIAAGVVVLRRALATEDTDLIITVALFTALGVLWTLYGFAWERRSTTRLREWAEVHAHPADDVETSRHHAH